jgi:hypothetical protein
MVGVNAFAFPKKPLAARNSILFIMMLHIRSQAVASFFTTQSFADDAADMIFYCFRSIFCMCGIPLCGRKLIISP